MVEVPAAVIVLDQFIEEIDFISIGTNDLIQYALAVDRGNKDVAHLYTGADPAVLRLIDRAINVARGADVSVSLCGQMAGMARYAMLLLGLGLRSFSMTANTLPEIKRVVRAVNIDECEALAEYALSLETARDIRTFLNEELSKRFPDLSA
jgi:phosphotransferase system enzyme I (PtsI)